MDRFEITENVPCERFDQSFGSKVIPSKNVGSRVGHFEGLRGFASLIVLIHHATLPFWPAAYYGLTSPTYIRLDHLFYDFPFRFVIEGNYAVCLFFILSGYVLTFKYKTRDDLYKIEDLFLSRYFRLVFPVLASILISFILLQNGLIFKNQAHEITKSLWLTYFFPANPSFSGALREAFIGAFLNNESSYNGNLWTMTIEFFGSFLAMGAAVLTYGLGRLRFTVLSVIMIILFLALPQNGIYYSLFIIGLIFAIFETRKIFSSKLAVYIIAIAGLYLGGANSGRAYSALRFLAVRGFGPELPLEIFLHAVGAVLFFFAVLRSVGLQSIFASRFGQYLGRLSFSLYLVHLPIILSLGCYVFIKSTASFTYNFAALISVVAIFVVSFLAAIIFSKLVDQPSVTFSRWIVKKVHFYF